jgi:hypothetical protein
MRTFRIAAASSAAALALVVGGCGSSDESRGESTPPTTTAQPVEEDATTTEPLPEPITAAETRWLQQVESYYERFEHEFTRSGTATQAAMRRWAKISSGCARMLRRAGDPGRLEPARRLAERGCNRLTKAARLWTRAASVSRLGGGVVAGTPEAAQFERDFNVAFEATGNAQYDLQESISRANEIKRTFGS